MKSRDGGEFNLCSLLRDIVRRTERLNFCSHATRHVLPDNERESRIKVSPASCLRKALANTSS